MHSSTSSGKALMVKPKQVDLYRLAVGEGKALEAKDRWRDRCPDCWTKDEHHPLCSRYVPCPVADTQESLSL